MLQLAVWQQHGSLGQGLWTFLIINTVSVPILSVIVCPLLRLLSFWLLLLWLLYITYHHYCHSLLVSNVFYVFHWCFSTNTACSTRNGESIRTESKRARLSCRKDGCHDIRKVNSRGAAMRSVVRGHVSTFNALRDIRPSFSMAGIPRDAPQLFFCFKIDSVKIWGLPDSWSFGSFSGNRRVIPDFFFSVYQRGVGFVAPRPMPCTRATPAGQRKSVVTRPVSPSSVGTDIVWWKPQRQRWTSRTRNAAPGQFLPMGNRSHGAPQ